MVLSVFGCFGDRQRQQGTSPEGNDGAKPLQDGETEAPREFARRSRTSAGETKLISDHGSAPAPAPSKSIDVQLAVQGVGDYGHRYSRPALTPSGQDPKETQNSAEPSPNARTAMNAVGIFGNQQQVSYDASALSSLPPAGDWHGASTSTDYPTMPRSLPSSSMSCSRGNLSSLIPGQLPTSTEVGQLVYVGQGAQGLVYRGTMLSSTLSAETGIDGPVATGIRAITVAVKFMICNTPQQLWHRAKEGLLSKLVSHPNLVSTLAMDVTLVTPNTQQEWLDKWVDMQRQFSLDTQNGSSACAGTASTFTRTTFSNSRSVADAACGAADASLQALVPPERPYPGTSSMTSEQPPAMGDLLCPPQVDDTAVAAAPNTGTNSTPYWTAGHDSGGGGGSGPRSAAPPPSASSEWPSYVIAAAAASLAVASSSHRRQNPPPRPAAWTSQVPSEQAGVTQDGLPPKPGMPHTEWTSPDRSVSPTNHPVGSVYGSACSSANTSTSNTTGAGPQPSFSHLGASSASTSSPRCVQRNSPAVLGDGHRMQPQIGYGEDGGEGSAASGCMRPGANAGGGSGGFSAPAVHRGGEPGARGGSRLEPVPFQDILYHLQAIPGRFVAKVIMEYCDGGTLLQRINAGEFLLHPSGGSRAVVASMRALLWCLQEIAAGMAHLHSLNIIHGDLKPSNVLLTSAASSPMGYECKVSDFGLATALEASEQTITYENWGTVVYMAPETCAGRCRKASDVYSFGVVMWQMVTGQRPYAGLQAGQVLLGVKTGTLSLQWPSWVHKSLVKVGQACLRFDPKERPGFKGIRSALVKVAARLEQKQAAADAAGLPDAGLHQGDGETGAVVRGCVGGESGSGVGRGGNTRQGFCCEIECAE